jgi:hypothetical protein
MPNDLVYFAVGAVAGLVIGAGLTALVTRLTGIFRTPEEARLAREVADLKRRIERKDRAIDEMMRHAADLAGRLPAGAGEAPEGPKEVMRR